jgi:hypothetical protein
MSSDERKILRRMKELGQVQLSPQDVEQMIDAARKTLADNMTTQADAAPAQPTLRPVPDASYGSAMEAQRGVLRGLYRRRAWRLLMKPSNGAIAAGIVIVVGVVALWIVLGRGANLAFADVLQQIREVHTVRYKQTVTCSMTGETPSTSTSEVLVADRYRSRSTSSDGDVIITDFAPGNPRMLTLRPQKKTAVVMRMTGRQEAEQPNLLDQLLKIDEKQARPIGSKQIAGCMADGFCVDTEGHNDTFWIDPQTRLPVLVEWVARPGVIPSMTVIMTDFEWNIPVDESLVSMIPPPGYEQNEVSLDLSTPTQEDLVAGLKTFAEFNQNRFPDDFSMKGMAAAMKPLEAKKDTIPQAEKIKISQKLMRAVRAFLFAGNPTMGQDWHYAGKGVPLGQVGTPILWYKPKDLPNYRVIYADLTVADVQPAGVPTVASVTIQPYPTPPTAPQSQPAGQPAP